MNWSNVFLIFRREARDQLRDRRTLFMIAVLPILLYPLMGMSFFQIAQFVREQGTRILILGPKEFEGAPPLVDGRHFAADLFSDPDAVRLLDVTVLSVTDPKADAKPGAKDEKSGAKGEKQDAKGDTEIAAADPEAFARQTLLKGQYEAVIYFSPEFSERLKTFNASLLESAVQQGVASRPPVPDPEVFFNRPKEKSQLAKSRVGDVLRRWRELIGERNLRERGLSLTVAKPFEIKSVDVAGTAANDTLLWAKILPFVVLLWTLTGAFYPAVDLCAGEKSADLETLLSSPAERIEIVWGKLLTVMLFSLATAFLNLLSLGVTGSLVLSQFVAFSLPPISALLWLVVLIVPMAALFSALCLALAVFARSTKEGQYYLMPLVLVTLPLVILPMRPGVELDLGNSLIPIWGVVLVLRTVMEGDTAMALMYIPVVMLVTLGCCLFAVRWAADQFNKESVLFRESERLDFGLWIKHLLRDREATPNVAMAVFCGMFILTLKFFMGFAMRVESSIVAQVAVVQVAVFATSALLMSVMLTRSPAKTLLLKMPRWTTLPAAAMLAIALVPIGQLLQRAVQHLYPMNEELVRQLSGLVDDVSLTQKLLLLAVLPAICEELVFRGFILSGLRHMGHKCAIIISSLFFGVAHTFLQQSISASLLGCVLGYLAVQTGSLAPCVLFHMVYNGSQILTSSITPEWLEAHNRLAAFFDRIEGTQQFALCWPMTGALALVAVTLLLWFRQLPYSQSAEESLQEKIEQNTPSMAGA